MYYFNIHLFYRLKGKKCGIALLPLISSHVCLPSYFSGFAAAVVLP
jgi:hypothetical protein